jgi:hypothetical protein
MSEVDISKINLNDTVQVDSNKHVKVSEFDEDLLKIYGIVLKLDESIKEESSEEEIQYRKIMRETVLKLLIASIRYSKL